jgi:hypothetical protein
MLRALVLLTAMSACKRVCTVQHEVVIPDNQKEQLVELPTEWTKFQGTIEEAGVALQGAKESFRERVRGMLDAFGAEITALSDDFAATAPFRGAGFTSAQVSFLRFMLLCLLVIR